jgi:recombinational DNA repair protein RecR
MSEKKTDFAEFEDVVEEYICPQCGNVENRPDCTQCNGRERL